MSRSKKNKAVALKYNAQEDLAPIVIASGYGDVAKRIIEVAESRGIPVFRDDSAVSLLCMLEVGSNIPPELYEAVAAIYLQLLRVSQQIKNTGWSATGAGEEHPARGQEITGQMNPVICRRRKAEYGNLYRPTAHTQ